MKPFQASTTTTRCAALMMAVVLAGAAEPLPVDPETLKDSAVVLGRIGVAKLALAYGLKGEAQANIKSAIDAVEELKDKAPKFSMSFARISYKTSSGAGQSLVPLVGGHLSAHVLDEKLLKSGATKTELTDTQVARAEVALDAAAVKAGLEKAEDALKRGKPEDARIALDALDGASLAVGVAGPGTLQLARDSLALAQQLLKDRDFKAAAFAADHAREALSAAADTDSALKAKVNDTNKAIKGLDDLGDIIRSGKPSGPKSPEAEASDLARQLEGLAPKG